jgi:hypothetical protein
MATVAPALRILAAAFVSRGTEREAVAMDSSEMGSPKVFVGVATGYKRGMR